MLISPVRLRQVDVLFMCVHLLLVPINHNSVLPRSVRFGSMFIIQLIRCEKRAIRSKLIRVCAATHGDRVSHSKTDSRRARGCV